MVLVETHFDHDHNVKIGTYIKLSESDSKLAYEVSDFMALSRLDADVTNLAELYKSGKLDTVINFAKTERDNMDKYWGESVFDRLMYRLNVPNQSDNGMYLWCGMYTLASESEIRKKYGDSVEIISRVLNSDEVLFDASVMRETAISEHLEQVMPNWDEFDILCDVYAITVTP